jgi:hypothetical protein
MASKQTYWSNITWMLLHVFPKTLSDEFYNSHKKEILKIVYEICVNVPCPICSKHAIEHLKKYSFFNENINKTPYDLFLNVFKFHNAVNKMLNKPEFNISDLVHYDNLDFLEIYKEWYSKYSINMINLKLSNHKQKVNKVRLLVNEFVKKNIHSLKINKTSIKTINVQTKPPQAFINKPIKNINSKQPSHIKPTYNARQMIFVK